MIVATAIPEVHEIMTYTLRQRVMIVSETQMHMAPWLHADEGWQESRLRWAVEAVCAGQVHDTGLAYEVQGDTNVYTIPKGALHRCPCPAAHYGASQHCKHRVALELFIRVRQAYPEEQPLPLPPVTVDERLALAPMILNLPEVGRVAVAPDGTSTPMAPTAQEDPMPDPYIPEPDDAPPVAAQDAPTHAVTTPATSSLDAQALTSALQAWSAQRRVITQFLHQELREGVDFYTLRIKGRDTKPTLSKAGAEKFLGLLQLAASFTPDLGTWEMLGKPTDQVLYVCTLHTRSGEVVGEGRGSRCLKQDGGDTNKSIKMASKSSLIDAVLRTGALSEVFTQDLEDQREHDEPAPPARPSSADLRQRIWQLVKQHDPTITTREQVMLAVRVATGLELEPDNYSKIVTALERA